MELTAETAREIARHLGDKWKLDHNEHQGGVTSWPAHLSGPCDLRLYLSTTWGPKGMLHISGSYPDYINRSTVYLKAAQSINVNPARGARAIAEEIERRLLPMFRTQLAEALKAHIADKQHKEGRKQTLDAVAAILGKPVRDPDGDRGPRDYRLFTDGQVAVEVLGPDKIEIDRRIYMTLEQFTRFKTALPELFEAWKEGE